MNARGDSRREGKNYDQKEDEREDHDRPRQLLPDLSVHLGGDCEQPDPDRHPDQLSYEKVGVAVAGLHLDDRAGAVHCREPEREENAREDYEGARFEPHVPTLRQICRCIHYASLAASVRKRSPRSS